MERTITVKGEATASVTPDRAELNLYLESQDAAYDKASEAAARDEKKLRAAVTAAGISPDALRTDSYNVGTSYEQERSADGSVKNVFKGYICSHSLRLVFPLADGGLQKVLDALAGCEAKPRFDVCFTVADKQGVSAQLLAAACADAKQKAEILVAASGAKLGQLLRIEYGANRPDFHSNARMSADGAAMMMRAAAPAIEPQELTVRDGASFVWELI